MYSNNTDSCTIISRITTKNSIDEQQKLMFIANVGNERTNVIGFYPEHGRKYNWSLHPDENLP